MSLPDPFVKDKLVCNLQNSSEHLFTNINIHGSLLQTVPNHSGQIGHLWNQTKSFKIFIWSFKKQLCFFLWENHTYIQYVMVMYVPIVFWPVPSIHISSNFIHIYFFKFPMYPITAAHLSMGVGPSTGALWIRLWSLPQPQRRMIFFLPPGIHCQ